MQPLKWSQQYSPIIFSSFVAGFYVCEGFGCRLFHHHRFSYQTNNLLNANPQNTVNIICKCIFYKPSFRLSHIISACVLVGLNTKTASSLKNVKWINHQQIDTNLILIQVMSLHTCTWWPGKIMKRLSLS